SWRQRSWATPSGQLESETAAPRWLRTLGQNTQWIRDANSGNHCRAGDILDFSPDGLPAQPAIRAHALCFVSPVQSVRDGVAKVLAGLNPGAVASQHKVKRRSIASKTGTVSW